MNMKEGILCPLCLLCCIINLQIVLPSIKGCNPFFGKERVTWHVCMLCILFAWPSGIEPNLLFFSFVSLHLLSLRSNARQNTGQLYVTHNIAEFHSRHPQNSWKFWEMLSKRHELQQWLMHCKLRAMKSNSPIFISLSPRFFSISSLYQSLL